MSVDAGTAERTLPDPETGYRRRVALGLGLCAVMLAGVGGWAATTELSGAVVASGLVVVKSSTKKVQHPTGGVVGMIGVKSGDRVEAGQVVLRLDDTQTRANLGIVVSQLTELIGRKARLAAERDGATSIAFPADFEKRGPDAERVAAGEIKLLTTKRQSIDGQKAQLKERIGQFNHEISGLSRQEKSKADELVLVKDELGRLEDMFKEGHVPITRVLAMRRDATRIDGEHGQLLSSIARAQGQISETEIKLIELEETLRAEAQKELRDVEGKIAELDERRIAAEDSLSRVEIRSPATGIVHELAAHTVGGVINAGDTVMSIVPLEEDRVVEVRLAPSDIDQVTVGQQARLRFPAFNQRTTPELAARVVSVAVDLSRDPQTGVSFYVARIEVVDDDAVNFRKLQLVAGMPVEGFIQTGERTALSYLTKPFADQLARTFKEND